MSIENQIPEAEPNSNMPPPNAVSVYGQDAMDDFPVLKAFQQYVDAEQAKAHKRMMTVCAFFAFIMALVIAVFMFIIFSMNGKETNSDVTLKVLEMMRQSQGQGPSAADLRIQEENLELKARVREQELERKFNERLAASSVNADVQQKNAELALRLKEVELEKKMMAELASRPNATLSDEDRAKLEELRAKEKKLEALEAKLKAREEKVAADAKQVKEERIDLQHRKLYPDSFSPEARKKADAEIRAAKDESERAQAEAREAVNKAMEAERAAQDAIAKAKSDAQDAMDKAEDAERAADLKEARLAKREKELAEKEKEIERRLREAAAEREAAAAARAAAPVVVQQPAAPVTPVVPAKTNAPSVEADEVLNFLDALEKEDTAPAPQKLGDYDMPLE